LFSNGFGFIDKSTVNVSYNHLIVDYDEFRDISTGMVLGEEPLYQLKADIFQVFFSFWY